MAKALQRFQDKLTVTKTGFQEEDFKVRRQLGPIKIQHDHLYQTVYTLSRQYSRCKHIPAPIRFFMLKSMIRECLDRSNEKTTGCRGLAENCSEIHDVMSDVGSLDKAELKLDISKTKQDIERLQENTELLQAAVKALQNDYKRSKNFGILERYRKFKMMAKRTIREMKKCQS